MYLYHITENKDVPMLLKYGLSPYIGERSKIVNETKPAIYLCQRKDIPYWKIILGKSTVLQINGLEIPTENTYQYSEYGESLYYQHISPDKIKKVYMPKPNRSHMETLCESYLWTISTLTILAARIYTEDSRFRTNMENEYELEECKESLRISIIGTMNVLQRLDYSIFSKKEIRKILKEMGDGSCTFVDMYQYTQNRLYKQLILYPEDETWVQRKQLYEYITKTFQGCLSVDTGGWTD